MDRSFTVHSIKGWFTFFPGVGGENEGGVGKMVNGGGGGADFWSENGGRFFQKEWTVPKGMICSFLKVQTVSQGMAHSF